MKANWTFLKSLVVSLSLIISLLVISEAQALYYFDWYDSGQEWYMLDDDIYPTIVEADKWEGFFTLPDSAVTYGAIYDDYQDISLDLSQYLDFSLTGNLISGNYIEAISFSSGSLTAVTSIGATDIGLYFFTGDPISYVMADPSWIHTPTYATIDGTDHWFYYWDKVFDPDTNSMVDAYISHDGIFAGHHVGDVNGDGDIDLKDVITCLKIIIGGTVPDISNYGDNKIGLDDVIYILNEISE